jgi:hypothetical protein
LFLKIKKNDNDDDDDEIVSEEEKIKNVEKQTTIQNGGRVAQPNHTSAFFVTPYIQ